MYFNESGTCPESILHKRRKTIYNIAFILILLSARKLRNIYGKTAKAVKSLELNVFREASVLG
jgi:hypothetical protein